MIRLSVPEPENRNRPSAYPMPVPRAPASRLLTTATASEITRAWVRSSMAKTWVYHLRVKPSQDWL
jgi:hypothetical protein